MTFPRVITIDGPAGVGKTSLAERLAEALGYHVYDTGALYRAATLLAARAGLADVRPEDEGAIVRLVEGATIHVGPPRDAASEPVVTIDGEDVTADLRAPAVNGLVSAVSQLPGVRDALLAVQRQAAAAGGVIMVGRDMGTVVVPDADLKLYLDADARVRAERRARQLAERGRPRPIAEIIREEAERDRLDSNRAVAPLRPAPDAIIIINDALTPEEVAERALHEVERAAARVAVGGDAG
jgi:CMP/dCMP kinase